MEMLTQRGEGGMESEKSLQRANSGGAETTGLVTGPVGELPHWPGAAPCSGLIQVHPCVSSQLSPSPKAQTGMI